MNKQLIDCIRNIASNFAALADEMDKNNIEINTKLSTIECETLNNRQALKDAANAILESLK